MINSLEININKEEKEFILERIEKILDSKINWTNSTNVLEFEETMKKITGSNYAIATSTGSTAIEASLIALGSSLYSNFDSTTYSFKCIKCGSYCCFC